ncbi:membrane protein [Luteimonas sp. FCS-9]|nr:membrane protein [Luteimonas sp. FCS-9]
MAAVAVVLVAAWGAFALVYQAPSPWRWPLLAAWLAVAVAVLASLRPGRARGPGRIAPAVGGIALLMLLGWWQTLTPSHARLWADDVARLLEADVDGSRVTLRNVRDFDWRSDDDYSVRWETRAYDLDRLVSADLILSYWMGPHIAHTLVSFGFDDGRQLVFSLEIRKERDEAFSAVGGFFREFETVLVAADEHDIVRVRSNVRGEDVYLYRLDVPPAQLREVFLGYLDEAARIRRQPRFYNTLTSNCTTIVFELARRIAPTLPLDYRLLLSGHFDGYAYDHEGLVPGYDLATLRAAGRITARARAFDGPAAEFPHAIRRGVPGVATAGAAP